MILLPQKLCETAHICALPFNLLSHVFNNFLSLFFFFQSHPRSTHQASRENSMQYFDLTSLSFLSSEMLVPEPLNSTDQEKVKLFPF